MAFVGLTHTGPQNFFQVRDGGEKNKVTLQYHDAEPNEFNEKVKQVCTADELPEEMRKVGWAKEEVNLADLYPDDTPLRKLKRENQNKVRKTVTEYRSGTALREDMGRNVRGATSPQEKWYAPLTSSQVYGWSNEVPGAASGVPKDTRCGKTSSDEARYAEAMFKQGMI